MINSVLRARGVVKHYGDVAALQGIDLDVAPGEICGLLGPNGAGKTTLVSIVAGLVTADAGEVTVDDIDVSRSPRQARRLLGVAPQDTGVYMTTTVRENLVFFAELASLRGAAARRRIEEVAEALELTDLLSRRVRNLSGGERRRLHTAVAMVHHPRLLLLDEPTTGVDVATRTRLLELVRCLAADGTAVCYSTHYLHEVEALAATVVILDGGQVIARGAVADLVSGHDTTTLELTFRGPAPEVAMTGERIGSVLRIRTDAVASVLPTLLGGLGSDAERLVGLEILRPNLESVFLALTGRRFDADADADIDSRRGADERRADEAPAVAGSR